MKQQSTERVVVTGGSGAIGRVIVEEFARDGATVVNLDRRPFPAEVSGPGSVHTCEVDLTEPEQIAAGFEYADEVFDGLAPDVLVCGATLSVPAGFLDTTTENMDLMYAINIRGMVLCGQEAARRMRENNGGRIVNIASISGKQAWAHEPFYTVSKAAQIGLIQAMAVELAPWGILVNGVGPGLIDVDSHGMAGTRGDEEIFKHDMDRIPLGRLGAAQEIFEAVRFLSRSTWTTGQTLFVDGGFLATGLSYFGRRGEELKAGATSASYRRKPRPE